MKWIEILRKNDVALLQSESDTQYAVVSGYDPTQPEDQQWSYGHYFEYWGDKNKKAACLADVLDDFRMRTENRYIPRCRLEELATIFKDKIIEEDSEYREFFDIECEMDKDEKEFFKIKEVL